MAVLLDPADAALRLAPEIPMAREETRTQADDGESGKSTFRVIERGLVAAMPAGKAWKIGSTILETGNRAARANWCCRLFARALSDRRYWSQRRRRRSVASAGS